VQGQNLKSERATLGELDVFSQLKEQLQGVEIKPATTKSEPVKTEEEIVEEKAAEVPVNEEASIEVEDVANDATGDEVTAQPVEVIAEEVKDAAPVEEKPVHATETVEKKASKSKAKADKQTGDDLRKIEGVGPKLAEVLNGAGITTYAGLAEAKPEELRAILESAGSRYKMFDPTTWPEQAALAAEGKWDELKELQGQLSGGRK
jgi:predicted flap endonuclease-1-like 5' DNA nuclease